MREKHFETKISSNLIRAQREESKNNIKKNQYLEKAANDSVKLANMYLQDNSYKKCIEYFLTAAKSYEKSKGYFQSKSCYKKLVSIYKNLYKNNYYNYYDKSLEGLSRVKRVIHNDFKERFNLEEREERISATNFLIWKNNGVKTNDLKIQYENNFNTSINIGTIRNYSEELENRNAVVIWGGPQGRPFRIYPNLMNLATRVDHYNESTLIEGTVQKRLTKEFSINTDRWNFNKEIFELNGKVVPSILVTVDMNAYVNNIDRFSRGLQLKAIGKLNKTSQLSKMGYDSKKYTFDVLDSNILIDDKTGEKIYDRPGFGG